MKRQIPFSHPFWLVGKRPDTEKHFPQFPVLWGHMGMEQFFWFLVFGFFFLLSPQNNSRHIWRWLKISSMWNYCYARDKTRRERWRWRESSPYWGYGSSCLGGSKTDPLKTMTTLPLASGELTIFLSSAIFACCSWKCILIGENSEIFHGNSWIYKYDHLNWNS